MAEESVKRITGFNPMVQAMSDISSMGPMPSYSDGPSDASVPLQDDMKQQQHFYSATNHHQTPATRLPVNLPPVVENGQPHNPMMSEVGPPKIGRTASMQRVASLEHLQKRFRGDVAQDR